MELTPVTSSNVAAVGYDDETKTLQVQFKGGETYNYFGVPQELYDNLLNAESVGGFLNTYIKPHFRMEKVTESKISPHATFPAQVAINAGTLTRQMQELLDNLRAAKPDDRSEEARRYAVTITEMEKVFGYFYTLVCMQGNP